MLRLVLDSLPGRRILQKMRSRQLLRQTSSRRPQESECVLTPEGVKVLGDKLGRGCKTEDGVDVLVLGKTDIGPDVLVSGSPDCKPVRLILGQGWGTVADLVPKVAPPPTPSVTPTTTRT